MCSSLCGRVSGCLNGLTAVCLHKSDHLRDGLGWKDGQQVGYQEVLEISLAGGSGAELAKSDSLAVIRPATTSINKGRVEAVHIEVLIVDKEALTHGSVSVIECMHIEPTKNERENLTRLGISHVHIKVLFMILTRVLQEVINSYVRRWLPYFSWKSRHDSSPVQPQASCWVAGFLLRPYSILVVFKL